MSELIELVKNAKITLPMVQVVGLVVALSVCLANKWTRSGLVIAYLAAYHWGWTFFAKQSTGYFGAYLVLGALVITLSVVDMIQISRK